MQRFSKAVGIKCEDDLFRVGDLPRMRWYYKRAKSIHIYALGDVGSTLLTGLKLMGGEDITELGVCDVREHMAERYAFEMNQILAPGETKSLPVVTALRDEELFDCDVFLFCASAGVPAVEKGGDVRMAQFSSNAVLVREMAERAVREGYTGLFGILSDPIEPLCLVAKEAGLDPVRVMGFGLGVMHARTSFFAEREPRFSSYLREGRLYGPHGEDLVVANSLTHYDDALSRELTRQTVQANLTLREMGFKPYIAPALSSGALTVLAVLNGEWNYSSIWMNGVYYGVRNRCTVEGIEVENPKMPDELLARCRTAYEHLEQIAREGAPKEAEQS